MSKADEAVLCVPAPHVKSVLENPYTNDDKLLALLNFSTHIRRGETDGTDDGCEVDPNWKQLIPYIVVANDKGQILAYNRGWKGGEDRLKGRWAIGFGGHVNDGDVDWMAGVYREIREELTCDEARSLDGPIGFINDDSDDVGRHHLGVVYALRADEVVPRENLEFEWVGMDDMEVNVAVSIGTIENWARLALPMVRAWMELQ